MEKMTVKNSKRWTEDLKKRKKEKGGGGTEMKTR